MERKISAALFEEAKKYFPGGVNSPVRAFKSVGGIPLFIKKGKGCKIWDEDGNVFTDYCYSWGPLILGHADGRVLSAVQHALINGTSFGAPTRYENMLGRLILENHPYLEKIRLVSSGTEAVMSAIRLARAYTQKNKILKFEGCYHGHSDGLLVKAGSGLVTSGITSSQGIPPAYAAETIVVELDDENAVSEAIAKHKNDIACIIIEPVPANNGLLLQRKEFLQFLRSTCTENNMALIFDEVISGFRTGFTGASGYYQIQPDIITFGKIIGGGLPVGAYGASDAMMHLIAPDGPVYQAGTLSGNPLSVAAGIAQLTACLEENFYGELERKTKIISDTVNTFAEKNNLPVHVFDLHSIFWISFSAEKNIRRASAIDPASAQKFSYLHAELLNRGIYLGPSAYEVGFVSQAHDVVTLHETAEIICDIVKNMQADKMI